MVDVGAWMLLALIVAQTTADVRGSATAEDRAVAFLSGEVPRWSRENHCFSCHNNGDAARALYVAARAGYKVPADSLVDTTRWLIVPSGWEHNGGDGPFSDKRLARVVFTTTLETAVATRWVPDRSSLVRAAERLVLDQAADGSWPLDGEDAIGSPATYGRGLATLVARNALISAGQEQFHTAILRADGWLANQEIRTITDATVCLMTSRRLHSPAEIARRRKSLALLQQGQNADGGWGPRANSPPEAFDTALGVLALVQCEPLAEVGAMVTRGRAFLIGTQQNDGGWIETTRPSGNVSYAQRLSTTGWATLALLASREFSVRSAPDPKR